MVEDLYSLSFLSVGMLTRPYFVHRISHNLDEFKLADYLAKELKLFNR
jgi:hypothetical protein